MTTLRATWRSKCHAKADQIRAHRDRIRTQWEADTEPGYSMGPLNEAIDQHARAVADWWDAIGGPRA